MSTFDELAVELAVELQGDELDPFARACLDRFDGLRVLAQAAVDEAFRCIYVDAASVRIDAARVYADMAAALISAAAGVAPPIPSLPMIQPES